MLEYVLYTIFFLSCIILVVVILLQPGKTDAGALFTSNISSNAFGPRGTATVLSKITIVTATIFMVSALLISMPALQGNVSVLPANPETPAENTNDSNTNSAANISVANSANPSENTNSTNANDANANANQ